MATHVRRPDALSSRQPRRAATTFAGSQRAPRPFTCPRINLAIARARANVRPEPTLEPQGPTLTKPSDKQVRSSAEPYISTEPPLWQLFPSVFVPNLSLLGYRTLQRQTAYSNRTASVPAVMASVHWSAVSSVRSHDQNQCTRRPR